MLYLQLMEPKGGGLALLLYSLVLSKGCDEVEEDLQDQNGTPLVRHDDTVGLCLLIISVPCR